MIIKSMSNPYLDFNATHTDLCITCIDIEVEDYTFQQKIELHNWLHLLFNNEVGIVFLDSHKSVTNLRLCVTIDGMGYGYKAIKTIKTLKKAFKYGR